MWVVDLPMVPAGGRLSTSLNRRLIRRRLQRVWRRLGLGAPVILTTLPHLWPYIERVPRRGLIYYCVDDFSHWPGADGEAVRAAESKLIRCANAVLAASGELHSRLSEQCEARYFPHAVDFEHFAAAASHQAPRQIASLPSPRLGFFGLIYEQLDFDLLEAVARAMPRASLVMIGPTAYCPESFRALPNVYFMGPQPYDDLPCWISACDVLLLAYRKTEMTRQVNPLKLKEYLATGKPIVSVDIPQARTFVPNVRLAERTEDFVPLIREALKERLDSSAGEARRSAVRHDTWDARAEELSVLLRELAAGSPSCVD
jgi:glycosyltransferase involved in cell wall biosynthesis